MCLTSTPGLDDGIQKVEEHKEQVYLVPHYFRFHSWLYIILNVGAVDVLAFAQLCLLEEPHLGVVAEVRVVLRHREGHGHLHAVGGVPATTGCSNEPQTQVNALQSTHRIKVKS